MKILDLHLTKEQLLKKCNFILTTGISILFFCMIAMVSVVSAQSVLFDFDNAPLHSPLPINQTVNGISARFSATGQGYSIQDINASVVPQGFTGRFIYPSSVYLADLLISFDKTLIDFSIMYSCQELGCDDAATMRVTAYKKGILAGTNTKIASHPGTWPVDTLSFSFAQGFDSLVIHYASRPPTCQDYGVIFICDNMRVTPSSGTAILNQKVFIEDLIIPNPVSKCTSISFSLLQSENISFTIYDIAGKLVKNLFNGHLSPGEHQINWCVNDEVAKAGIYFLKINGENFSKSCKLVVAK